MTKMNKEGLLYKLEQVSNLISFYQEREYKIDEDSSASNLLDDIEARLQQATLLSESIITMEDKQ